MENLTPKQQEIIQSIKEQFYLINSSRPKKSDNPLLKYANEFNEVKHRESEERAIIEAKNYAMLSAIQDEVESNVRYIKKLLVEANLWNIVDVKYNGYSITLSNKNYEIYISYTKTYGSYTNFLYEKNISPYYSYFLKFNAEKYESFEAMINGDDFRNKFKNMLNY